MGILNLGQRKPVGASCGWTLQELTHGAPYGWWRTPGLLSCEPNRCMFYWTNAGLGSVVLKLSTTIGGAVTPGITYSFGITTACGTLGTYITLVSGRLRFDVWKALADGAWSSSLAITLNYYTNATRDVIVASQNIGNAGAENPTYTSALTPIYTAYSACATTHTKTITWFDDGTVTFT